METQVFKSKFDAWDDVLAVDFTRTAENVSKKGADMNVRTDQPEDLMEMMRDLIFI